MTWTRLITAAVPNRGVWFDHAAVDQLFSPMKERIQGVHRVTETLVAVKGKTLVRIPRAAIVEVTDRSKLPSFVDVVWNAEVYSVRRVDFKAKTTQLAAV